MMGGERRREENEPGGKDRETFPLQIHFRGVCVVAWQREMERES